MSFGLARTQDFAFQAAEVMLGTLGTTNSLIAETNSLGLAKDVQVKVSLDVKRLEQGVSNDIVDTTRTGRTVEVTGNLHEYTARNLAYLSMLTATAAAYDPPVAPTSLTALIAAAGVVANVVSATGFTVGETLIILRTDRPHSPHVCKVVSVASLAITFAPAVPAGMDFPVALTRVMKPARIEPGGENSVPSFSCKIVSQTKLDNRPKVLMLPKVQIASGLNISFGTDNYGALPFTLTGLTLVPTDTEFADYVSAQGERLPIRLLKG